MHHSTLRLGLCCLLFGVAFLLPHTRTTHAADGDLTPGTHIQRDDQTGLAEFITITDPDAAPPSARISDDPETVARAFLAANGSLFGFTPARAADGAALVTKRIAASDDGTHAVRFLQTYQRIPVLAGELQVNVNPRGRVASANGELLTELAVDTNPRISPAAAQESAITYAARAYHRPIDTLSATPAGLWIFHPRLLGSPELPVTTLNWRFEVRDGGHLRALVLVDAHTGAITLHFNQTADALNQRVCDAQNIADTDYNQDTDCAHDAQAERLNEATPTGNTEVDTAWDNAKATYEFYQSVLDRDSIDDAGMKIISLVNYCPDSSSCPYQNAFWDGIQMTYGATFASADDVVGHELTHGVTEKTAELYYYYQSGAINESLSDIFGELIDQSFVGSGGDATSWLMGEDLPIGAIRSMADPGSFGDPDKMTSSKYNTGLYLGEMDDQGGVHSNSGVGNKTAYLLAAGGSFNGYTVAAIGNTKTALLFYRVMTHYLTSGSDYADLGASLNAACLALRNEGSAGIDAADCAAVRNAVLATELAKTPPRAPATDAPGCTAAETKVLLYSDTFDPVVASRWTTSPTGENDWHIPAPKGWKYATSGVDSAALLSPAGEVDQRMTMTSGFFVAPGTVFSFRHAYEFEAYYSNAGAITESYDGAIVEYSIDGGRLWQDAKALFTHNGYNTTLTVTKNTNILAGRAAFSGYSRGFVTSNLRLDSLAGSNVRFRFRAATDRFVSLMGWYIDDVAAYRCLTSAQAVQTFSSGADHTCVLSYNDTPWCWGLNTTGQLGTGTKTTASRGQTVKTTSGTLADIRSISAGTNHTCAVTNDGAVFCWGSNTAGQLGDGTKTSRTVAVGVTQSDATLLNGQTSVSVGDLHTCALANAGTVQCWGANANGELGDRTHTNRMSPVTVKKSDGTTLASIKAISVGAAHTCALTTTGSVWCWGSNAYGALGTTRGGSNGAVQVTTASGLLSGITQLSAGTQYTCALAGTAATWCWGKNGTGQLGDGTTANRYTAVSVKTTTGALKNIQAIAAGRGGHSCAVATTGVVLCWGANHAGQLGDGTLLQRAYATPQQATAAARIGPVRDVEVGAAHSCVRTNGGAVWCWGDNAAGQLGNGTLAASMIPTRSRNTVGVLGE